LAEIKKDYGTTQGFFKAWGISMPKSAVDNLKELEKATIKPNNVKEGKKVIIQSVNKPLTLIFVSDEHDEFISIGESLYPLFKTDNITDLSLNVFRYVKKNYKPKK
jgi:hypothetical protein